MIKKLSLNVQHANAVSLADMYWQSDLKLLVEQGIFTKVPYTDTQKRYEYRLTQKGLDLYPLILSMVAWGDKWIDEGMGAPLEYHHKLCSHKFTPVTVCSECGAPIFPNDVQPLIGPGLYAFHAKQND